MNSPDWNPAAWAIALASKGGRDPESKQKGHCLLGDPGSKENRSGMQLDQRKTKSMM